MANQEHPDLSVARITAIASVIAALLGGAAAVTAAWIAAGGAVQSRIVQSESQLSRLQGDLKQMSTDLAAARLDLEKLRSQRDVTVEGDLMVRGAITVKGGITSAGSMAVTEVGGATATLAGGNLRITRGDGDLELQVENAGYGYVKIKRPKGAGGEFIQLDSRGPQQQDDIRFCPCP